MASKVKSTKRLSEANKRLKLDSEDAATSSPRYGLQGHNEVTVKAQEKNFQISGALLGNTNALQQTLSSECTIAPDGAANLESDIYENPTPSSSFLNPLVKEELTQEQKMRMELNKAVANAIRNVKICEENVSKSRVEGLSFPEFKSVLVEQKWSEIMSNEFGKTYMEKLYRFVKEEAASGSPIYPPAAKVFNAFNTCPFEKVKVVIIGQDPYHGPGQAMGLCFSIEKGVKFPPSLLNILKEIQDDVGCSIPSHGNLEKWSYQGVLLLNTALTVRGGKANSHSKKGWEEFTDAAIKAVASHKSGVIFLLWGNSAQEKTRLINQNSHHILKAAHPSGLSAHKGFFKCKHFSQTNKILKKQGLLPIDWQI